MVESQDWRGMMKSRTNADCDINRAATTLFIT